MLIVDEGHQIKNPSCQSGRSLRRIKARSRILLTGLRAQVALDKFRLHFESLLGAASVTCKDATSKQAQ